MKMSQIFLLHLYSNAFLRYLLAKGRKTSYQIMSNVPYIDFHCHSYSENYIDVLEIVSTDPSRNVADGLHTIGFHPWWHLDPLQDEEISHLKKHILANKTCLAVGECGLDKFQGADLDLQIHNFELQIQLANALRLPLIVHCVRKYDSILQLFKKHAQTTWVIHGFKRDLDLATKMVDQGIRLSVAPHENMTPVFETCLKSLPLEMIHLETDSDRRTSIQERYQILADLRQDPVDEIRLKMYDNTKSLFRRM